MKKEDIIDMARKAGLTDWATEKKNTTLESVFERFATMAFRAGVESERKRQEEQLHTCSAVCDRPLCVARRRGAEEEREACAAICDAQHDKARTSTGAARADACAAAIRARSKT